MDERSAVVDASALIDLLAGLPAAAAVDARLDGVALHAPAHMDAEVLSGPGRLQRAGSISVAEVTRQVAVIAGAPIERHLLADLLPGAWKRRGRLRLADALYVELATALDVPLVTTDARLGRAARIAEVVTL